MEVEIIKFDNNGRGIAYLNDKIVFVPKSVPGDILNIERLLLFNLFNMKFLFTL